MGDGMVGPFTIFFASVFTNNILLANYLGMCPFIGVSRRMDDSRLPRRWWFAA